MSENHDPASAEATAGSMAWLTESRLRKILDRFTEAEDQRVEQLEKRLADSVSAEAMARLDADRYWTRGWVWGFIAGLSVMFAILVNIGG